MTPDDETYDTIVVGAGQAGLGMAHRLEQDGRRFLVLERGRAGETWRTQRWDSFALNTPNWANVLPGTAYEGPEPDGFWHRDELVRSLEQYVSTHALPVRTGVTVTSVEAAPNGGFVVGTDEPGREALAARTIVIASGIMQTPRLPALSSEVPRPVKQQHTADYRSPDTLPPGAAVVVGSGQSGCQIVEDLLAAGRTVYLCCSKVGRVPRRYRGRDIVDWWRDMGFLDMTVEDLPDPAMRFATQPQTSGLGRYGHTVSLQQLAQDGARLLGRLIGVEDGSLIMDDRLSEYIRFADEKSAMFKRDIDAYLARNGIDPPPLEDDAADAPAEPGAGRRAPTRLDLAETDIKTIIWCTGFTADFSWIRLPVVDESGSPMHRGGVAPVPGLYFLGFPWLRSRKSGLILGVAEDSRHVASAIAHHLDSDG